MNPFLAAFANTYIDGEKARPDLATTYQPTDPVVDQGGFAFGGQALGQTANDVAAPTGYTPPPVTPQAPTGLMTPSTPQTAAPPASGSGGLFGSGAATPNRSAEQLSTIRGTWNQYLNGQFTAAQIMQMMTQYGVNYADIAAATGKTPQEIEAMVGGRPQGTTAPASGLVSNVGVNPNDAYMDQLNRYYGAYFEGGKPETSMLNSWYSSGYNPPPTGFSTANKGASSAQGITNSLQWGTPELDAKSTSQLYKYMNQYGLTAKNLADALGFSEQQIVDHFRQYGITVNATPTNTTPNPNAALDRPNDGG
jgi:plasmid maintenance system antidote protein VapI